MEYISSAVSEAEEIITDAMVREMLGEADGILAKNAAKYAAEQVAAKSSLIGKFGRAAGIVGILIDLVSISGSSDQRPREQYSKNQEIIEQEIQRIKTDTEIKLTYDEQGRIVIYRWGKANLKTITPTPGKDAPEADESSADFLKRKKTIGMSWSLLPPPPGKDYVKTTLEQVNATGVLVAIPDGGIHVSIAPARDGLWNDYKDLRKWAETYQFVNQAVEFKETYDPNKASEYTKKLREICTSPDGGIIDYK